MTPKPVRLLSRSKVAERLDVSISTINLWLRKREFPQPLILPGGVKRWLESELEDWIGEISEEREDDGAVDDQEEETPRLKHKPNGRALPNPLPGNTRKPLRDSENHA